MAYVCKLGTGQNIYLDNQGSQTIITTISSSPGQQQQSSSGFTSGNWTALPQLFRTPNGVLIKIIASNGEHFVQVQGNSIAVMNSKPTVSSSQEIDLEEVEDMPDSSMPRMERMKMKNMEMNFNPMEMRMGDMEMKMSSSASASSSSSSSSTRRYCSQCGAKVNESDRFCASCGHRLS